MLSSSMKAANRILLSSRKNISLAAQRQNQRQICSSSIITSTEYGYGYNYPSTLNNKTTLLNIIRLNHTSTNTNINNKANTDSIEPFQISGEECYNLSLEYYKTHTKQQKDLEEKNAKEQYEAMMKMSPNNSIANSTSDDGNIEITKTKKQTKIQNRQANIAVVQTIAKQTREQNKNKNKNKNNCGNNSHNHSDGKCQKEEEVDLEKKSKEYMQYAAFVHGYPKALVQLANDALELAKQSESESLQNPYTYITPSMETIINVEELIQSNESFVEVAKFLYQQAIDRGNNNAAMYNLAHLLWTESQEIQNNNNDDNNDHDEQEEKMMKSIQLFHKAAMELNDIDALYFTGVQYITLLGTISSEEDTDDDNILNQNQSSSLHMNVIHQIVNQNDELKSVTDLRQLGYEMIHKASDDDHAGASYYLSLLHRNGDMDLKVPVHPSICKFQHYLNLACDGDVMDSDALYLRAHCTYHNEDGYGNENEHGSSEHSMKEAFSDFMKAGEAGNPNGYISAGAMLHHGQIGIPQDQRRAFELYQEAGEMGSKDGWRNVVACHALGQGVPQCEQTAKYISKTMLSDDDVYQE